MGQVRHGSATTTHAVRAAIQRSQASLSTLSQELGINTKIAAKWRKRATVEDLKTGPKAPHSTSLTEAEEAAVVAFQRHTLLPLDDCLYALQPSIPHLTRSGGGHVAFAVGEDATHFHVLGGNQGARVSIMRIEKARLAACRTPIGWTGPKLPLLKMPATAGITVSRNEA